MDLYDQIEKETKALEEEVEQNDVQKEEKDESVDESVEEESKEESDEEAIDGEGEDDSDAGADDDSEESGEKEEGEAGADEGKDEEEKQLTNADFARLRREKKALERKLAEKDSIETKVETKVEEQSDVKEDKEPDPEKEPAEWLAWNDRRIEKDVAEMREWKAEQQKAQEHQELYKQAATEFSNYEAEFEKEVDDYEPATKHYIAKISDGIRTLHPELTKEQVGQAVTNHLFQMAGQFVSKGLNPAEEIYHMAFEHGYTATSEERTETKTTEKKVDLKKVDRNRKRSASGLSGSGAGKQSYTLEDVANMTNGQLANLNPEVLRQLDMEE